MMDLCDTQKESLLTVANTAHQVIYQQYGCKSNKHAKRCSPFELAAKQFLNSEITLNPISTKFTNYKPTLTGKEWNSELQEFEYRNYLN